MNSNEKERDVKTLTLTSEYSIEKRGGYALVYTSDELFPKKTPITGKIVMKPNVEEFFYGTVYGALQGFLRKYASDSSSLDEVILKVNEALRIVDESCADIEDKYKIVRIVKP